MTLSKELTVKQHALTLFPIAPSKSQGLALAAGSAIIVSSAYHGSCASLDICPMCVTGAQTDDH